MLNHLRKYIFIPCNVQLALMAFGLRKFFFGFANANLLLQRVSKPCIIPILRKQGASIGENCDIETGLTIHNCKEYSHFIIGDNCHIGKNCLLDLREKIIIKNNVVISMQCSLITHIDLSRSDLRVIYPAETSQVLIEDNVYLGCRVIVLMGVTINRNSFVAAGATVVRDVPEKCMVGGSPAILIKELV
jgi:acetyltransferase-like isoleucine patch superfamily enzyme